MKITIVFSRVMKRKVKVNVSVYFLNQHTSSHIPISSWLNEQCGTSQCGT